tara:strand:- start:3665 stop:4153 length:489 start_codon:yes stop_codon:yes gene_type:complete
MWKKIKSTALIGVMFIVYLIGNLLVWIIDRATRVRLIFTIWWHRKKFADLKDNSQGYTSTILSVDRLHFKPEDLIIARHGGVRYMKVKYRPVAALEIPSKITYEGFADLYWADGTVFTTKKPLESSNIFRYTLRFNVSNIHANQGTISSCSINLNAFTFTLK